jgi:hypothetical protein
LCRCAHFPTFSVRTVYAPTAASFVACLCGSSSYLNVEGGHYSCKSDSANTCPLCLASCVALRRLRRTPVTRIPCTRPPCSIDMLRLRRKPDCQRIHFDGSYWRCPRSSLDAKRFGNSIKAAAQQTFQQFHATRQGFRYIPYPCPRLPHSTFSVSDIMDRVTV